MSKYDSNAFDECDINNLKDIYTMYSLILSSCKLTPEAFLAALKTKINLKDLLEEFNETIDLPD